ncbi:MAG: glycosyl transferase [Acidimicrobiaceae bacterium]|nr:glycosyl transferase [Acidimicrobiaceae bacterium]
MIVKDEEDEIALALASAAELVDEVVVYDTGSCDQTVPLAREAGATVIEGYWDDDFSRARNAALAACTGEWILWLDADESVHGDFAGLRELLSHTAGELDAYAVSIESIEGSGLGGRSAFYAHRLFRRSTCQWFRPFHEQIGLRQTGKDPASLWASPIRILHRGYTNAAATGRSKVERNLRLARRAAEEASGSSASDEERAYALFNLGRTIAMTEDPVGGEAHLRTALDLTSNATLRRYTLHTLVLLDCSLHDYDKALGDVAELRQACRRHCTVDALEARVLLESGDPAGCLRVLERIGFVDIDDDGMEQGRHTVAALRARALLATGRPSEAADALLEAISSHGVLDEPLSVVTDCLLAAGRSPAEVALAIREESLALFAAAASRLPADAADTLLVALTERFPGRSEPLAAAASAAPGFPVERALHWSAALRRKGLAARCPLVAIGTNGERPVLDRLQALAAAYGSFAEERSVGIARSVLGDLGAGERAAALGAIAGLSPRLAELAAKGHSVALHLHRGAEPLPGWEAVRVGDRSDGSLDPLALPHPDGTVHELVADGVLAGLTPDEVAPALFEWARVLAPAGRLEVRVPNLEVAARALLAGEDLDVALRAVYGRRRFGRGGSEEANACGFLPSTLRGALEQAGFEVEALEEGIDLVARARPVAVAISRAGDEVPQVSVVVLAGGDPAALRASLAALASAPAGASFEAVVLAGTPPDATALLLASLAGNVTTWTSPQPLDRSRGLALASRLCRAPVMVLLEEGAEVGEGWAGPLLAALEDPVVLGATAKVVGPDGFVLHAGYSCTSEAGGSGEPRLVARARHARLEPSSPAVVTGGPVTALGPGCVALRRDALVAASHGLGGLGPLEHLLDCSLALRELMVAKGGVADRALTYVPGTVVRAPAVVVQSDQEERERLAYRWAARAALPEPPAPKISLASLLPSTTLVDRLEDGLGGVPVPNQVRHGGVTLVADLGGRRAPAGLAAAYGAAIAGAGLGVVPLSFAAGRLTAPRPGEDAGGLAPSDAEPYGYSTTLLCVEGAELAGYVASAGLDSLRERRTIAAWQWPLSVPARDAIAQMGMLAELWVPSAFSRAAHAQVGDRPVAVLPPAVLPAVASPGASRERYGLPGGFLFVSFAELGSCQAGEIACANPIGLLEAYLRAFGEPSSETGLCLRLLGREDAELTADIEALVGDRPDVVVKGGPLGVQEEDDLLALADAYATVQRASAFCLPLARAVASAKVVVAPRYGGPAEYLDPDPARDVPWSPGVTTDGHLPFSAGSPWAEPDLSGAAAALSAARHATPAREVLAQRADRLLAAHGAQAASQRVRARLASSAPTTVSARVRHHQA